MRKSTMMKNTQILKINESIEKISQLYTKKQQLFKRIIPTNQILINNLQRKTECTLQQIPKLLQIVYQDQYQFLQLQKILQKFFPFEIYHKKQSNNTSQKQLIENNLKWANHIVKLQDNLILSHQELILNLKNASKQFDGIIKELKKEQDKYKDQIKEVISKLRDQFQKIDQLQTQQRKTLTKMIKESKKIGKNQKNDSISFICFGKKLQKGYLSQINTIIQRNKLITNYIKLIIKNQNTIHKKIHQQFNILITNRKKIFSKLKTDDKIIGSLMIMEEGVSENCQAQLQSILTQQQIQIYRKFIDPKKNNLQTIFTFLNSDIQGYERSLQAQKILKDSINDMSFKHWCNISLASGWIITSFTPVQLYLMFDHLIAIFDLSGNLLQKIQASNTKISKVQDNNIYLSQNIKGFFTNSISQYQIKFESYERMEEFQLFIENQIQ